MACSIVASHTRGSSTYGLRNEAGDARRTWLRQHSTPLLLVLPHPIHLPAYLHLANHLRAADLGRGIVVGHETEPLRSPFVYEVVTKSRKVENSSGYIYYVL